jgi:glycosyltransferase involved in cell wall biosynthesis
MSAADVGRDPSQPAKVVYLHGRPSAHPLHAQFAEALGADFSPVDLRLRWQDRSRSRPYIASSWLLSAATLPRRRNYDVFVVDGLHVGPVLMKRFFLRKEQKVIAHLASHTLYFLLTNRFDHRVTQLHLWALRNYDALICDGRMGVEIVQRLLGDRHPPIYENSGGVNDRRADALALVKPDLAAHRMVFVGGGPNEFRMHYKGLDLMVDAFAIAAAGDPALHFDIVGEWDEAIRNELLLKVRDADRARIQFVGSVTDDAQLGSVLARAALYVHCSRGDAFPGSSIEAMIAGLVPLVSEWTGTKQLVEQVDARLVVPLDSVEIAGRIAWYFALSPDQRVALSQRSRDVATPCTATAAAAGYAEVFRQACQELGISLTPS